MRPGGHGPIDVDGERNTARLREFDPSPDQHIAEADSTREVCGGYPVATKRRAALCRNLALVVPAEALFHGAVECRQHERRTHQRKRAEDRRYRGNGKNLSRRAIDTGCAESDDAQDQRCQQEPGAELGRANRKRQQARVRRWKNDPDCDEAEGDRRDQQPRGHER